MNASTAFGPQAARYDELWTRSAVGCAQREAVWRAIDGLFRPGERVLDLGCGTGEDAARLAAAGVRVHAVDAAAEMIGATRERSLSGVTTEVLAIEELRRLSGPFDGAISNFGALNCVPDLTAVARELERLVRPGGRMALCTLGRFCLWETVFYLLRAQVGKAFRRLRRDGVMSSLGVRVRYPGVRELAAAFSPGFRLRWVEGVGIFVPPSYVPIGARWVRPLAALDGVIRRWPMARACGDHRLVVLVRK